MTSDSYHVVGSDFDDTFTYVSSDGTPFTGKVEGDFTIEVSKNGTGNQALTGITITEVDATNNAGEYQINVDGGTGFTSVIDDYVMVIFDTAASQYRWRSTIRVTANGDPALTDGIAFTATADDGRITGDDTPLSGATVRILDSSSNVIAQFTSDASGLWGPVYLNDSSTYSIHAQATAYTSTTAAINTSGGTAVGPLADVDIITAATTSDLQASKLWAYARRMSHDKVGSKATTQIKQAVNSALGMLGKINKWNWLIKRGRINPRAFSNSGTVAVTDDSTTVTLTGSTFPSWVAGTEFIYDGVATKISTRDSDTQITLEFAFNGTSASGANYTIFQYKYDLPNDCLQIDHLLGGQRFPTGSKHVDMGTLEEIRDTLNFSNPDAYYWASSGGKMVLWPYPSEDRMLNYIYYAKPADLVSDSDTADWDIAHISILHRAIDYHVSVTMGCVAGSTATCWANFENELTHHLPNDKAPANVDVSVGSGKQGFGYFSTVIAVN